MLLLGLGIDFGEQCGEPPKNTNAPGFPLWDRDRKTRQLGLRPHHHFFIFTHYDMDPEFDGMMQQAQGRGAGPQARADAGVPDK